MLAALWRELDTLHARMVPGFFEVPGSRRAEESGLTATDLRHLLSVRDATLLVAIVSDEVVGCVRLELYDTPPLPGMLRRRRVHVERIVVSPAARRAGVGRRLMEAAAAWCVAQHGSQIVLTVWHGNECDERFYQALGYLPLSRMMGRDLP